MTTVNEFAPAKVNLTLHITGQRRDGYHLLDSLVVFPDLGDCVEAEPADKLGLTVTGPFAVGVPTGADNLMIKAAKLLDPGKGAALSLTKSLPHPAGIGGGSSDAAATLRALSQLWNLPLPPAEAVATLGADVPVCMSSMPQRMQRVGELLSLEPAIPAFWLVLVNPGVSCPTGSVFGRLASKSNSPMSDHSGFDGFSDFVDWLRLQRNDLETPAIVEVPDVAEVLAALDQDAALARMSGSGATCFGVYETERQANAAVVRLSKPGWWVRAAAVT